MDDIVTRSGRNIDVVFTTIAATLVDPTIAVVAALLSALYASKPRDNKPLYRMSRDDYSRLRDIVYGTIINHTDRIRRKLIDYGIRKNDVDALMNSVVYDGYMDSLIATYS